MKEFIKTEGSLRANSHYYVVFLCATHITCIVTLEHLADGHVFQFNMRQCLNMPCGRLA